MLGSYFSPQSGVCTSGWSAGTYTQCYTEQGIWMVGLIAASVSTLLVLLMCMHFILRLRAAQVLPPCCLPGPLCVATCHVKTSVPNAPCPMTVSNAPI